MDLNALGLFPEDEEEDEVSLTCIFMGIVLRTLYVFCMSWGTQCPVFHSFFPDYCSNVIDAKPGKGPKVVS